jgi:uncharacterized protein
MNTNNSIEVCSYKYDGKLSRRWYVDLISQTSELLVVRGIFQEEVNHRLLGLVERGTVSTEYFWFDRWYNVFQFVTPAGKLRNYYCNINQPPEFDGKRISFIDLDIDILVMPDLSYQLLDEDEFELNARQFGYTAQVHNQVKNAIQELTTLIETHQFPFTGKV